VLIFLLLLSGAVAGSRGRIALASARTPVAVEAGVLADSKAVHERDARPEKFTSRREKT